MADMVKITRPSINRFLQEPQISIGRSQFDRSHGLKCTFDVSYLYPILVDEVLPGDTFTCKLNGFCRVLSPLDAPIMDNIELETFFFFVPTRLVWSNWVYFNGEHDEAGAQDTSYTIPILNSGTVDHIAATGNYGRFFAQLGIAQATNFANVDVNALPGRCYNLIYNEWFRGQNLIDEIPNNVGNGPDASADYVLQRSAKKHDYFTSGLPYLQKGDAATILGQITTFDVETGATTGEKPSVESTVVGTSSLDAGAAQVDLSGVDEGFPLYVDLTGVGTIDVNTLRESVAIQRLLERDARGGTRYVEMIKSHFGVTSPDFRLQRPEFLGGGKSYINVSAVANTVSQANANSTAASGDVEQGELRGIGTGVISGHGWAKSFTEHGFVMGILRARGDITYFQGIERFWNRSTRYDFYIPALANLGEQAILNRELRVTGTPATDNGAWGYQERWSEYRYKPSRIAGFLNPDVGGALSHWHLAEDFAGANPLNKTFIEDQTPMSRVITMSTAEDFLLDLWFNYKCARPMPVHSIPSITEMRF